MSLPQCFARHLKPECSEGLEEARVGHTGLLNLILFSVRNKVMGLGELLSE